MMDGVRFDLIIIFLAQISSPVFGVHCPTRINDRIQQCVQPVAQYAKILNQQRNYGTYTIMDFFNHYLIQERSTNNVSTASTSPNHELGQALALPKLGGQVFKELCRLIRNFDDCVKEFREPCPRHITISLIDASYGFLCNEGYDTFMTSAECLMELDQRPAVKQCHDETLADIERTNNEHGIAMPAKLDRMCEALNFFSGCVRLPIRQDCGHSAWAVIFRVLRDTTRTLMPACLFTGESSRLQLVNSNEPGDTTVRPTDAAFDEITNRRDNGRSGESSKQLPKSTRTPQSRPVTKPIAGGDHKDGRRLPAAIAPRESSSSSAQGQLLSSASSRRMRLEDGSMITVALLLITWIFLQ